MPRQIFHINSCKRVETTTDDHNALKNIQILIKKGKKNGRRNLSETMPEQGVATVNYVVQLASSSSTLCASYRVELGSLDTICMHLLL